MANKLADSRVNRQSIYSLGKIVDRIYGAVFPSTTKSSPDDTDKVVVEDVAGDRYHVTADQFGLGGGGSGTGKPMYIYIKATGQSEGDLHLSDATNWNVSLALIKEIRVETSSTDWDLYLLQNDNGYVTDDANIPARELNKGGNGDETVFVDLPYEDEDATNEVHLYWLDNSGSNTADIYITAYELSDE